MPLHTQETRQERAICVQFGEKNSGGGACFFFQEGGGHLQGGPCFFFREGRAIGMVSWCHGVMVSTPGPTSRRRQLPAVPAGPEWHNTAASATPCATLREPPPPFPALLLSTPHGMGTGPTTQPGPHAGPCAHRAPDVFSSAKSNKFCMGTHPVPSGQPKAINFAWAHTQCLQFCQK